MCCLGRCRILVILFCLCLVGIEIHSVRLAFSFFVDSFSYGNSYHHPMRLSRVPLTSMMNRFRWSRSGKGSGTSNSLSARASSLQESETDTVEHLTSLSTLSKRLALLTSNTDDDDDNSLVRNRQYKLTFAIAGGGSQAISSLASTPGASAILYNGNLLYDRISFAQYLSQYLPKTTNFPLTVGAVTASNSSSSSMHGSTDSSTRISNTTNIRENHLQGFTCTTRDGKFGFASPGAAILLSQAAFHQAGQMTKHIQNMQDIIGVGCTSTLVSHGREDRVSRVHIALSTMADSNRTCTSTTTSTTLYNIQLSNHPIPSNVEDASLWRRRNRGQEEELVARLVLNTVLSKLEHHLQGNNIDSIHPTNEDIIRLDIGDAIECRDILDSSFDKDENSNHLSTLHKVIYNVRNPEDSCNDAAILVPSKMDGTMIPLPVPILPLDTIVFPGSFNPPHSGHVALAQAALKVIARKKKFQLEDYFRNNSSNDNYGIQMSNEEILEQIWATTALKDWKDDNISDDENVSSPFTVLFEMSLTNVDKPSMEVSEAIRRIDLFSGLESDLRNHSIQASSSIRLPKDWGVLLTSAPMFIDKVKCLKKYIANHAVVQNRSSKPVQQIIFVIGTDTLVRIINPKYYDNDYDKMLAALRHLFNEGVHFLVGGRVEQVKTNIDAGGSNGILGAKYISGHEEVQNLPRNLQDMFTLMSDFRFDISSTELRRTKKSE